MIQNLDKHHFTVMLNAIMMSVISLCADILMLKVIILIAIVRYAFVPDDRSSIDVTTPREKFHSICLKILYLQVDKFCLS